jgi:hypothetical protein
LQLNKQLLEEMAHARDGQHARRLGQYTGEVFKLPTLLGSRTNGRSAHAFVSNKESVQNDSLTRGEQAPRQGPVSVQKGCVWDASRNAKSLCTGEDLLKHIHHIKVNSESEKGLSLTEVCRISMRTRDFLARSLQWLDSAMAHLQLKANALGRVTESEFVEILGPFTEGVMDLKERHLLFSRLDGENKGSVKLELTESERNKYEELKGASKSVESVMKMNQVISAMQAEAVNAMGPAAKASQQHQMAPMSEEAEQQQSANTQVSAEPITEEMVASCINYAPDVSSTSREVDCTQEAEAMNMDDDEELRDLERRLEELRSMQAARLRQRRKRELEAEIEALQRELEAKTPKARTPHAASSPHASSATSKVSFALPSALSES